MDSPTLAMSDVYEVTAPRLDAYSVAFYAESNQRGAVVAIDGKPVGMELFDSPVTFARYLERLVGSYALDAIETARSTGSMPTEAEVRQFLDALAETAGKRFPAIGEGQDIRLGDESIAGGALTVNGRLVHLACFAIA